MKESLKLSALAAGTIAAVLCAGCASVSLPPAKGYSVQVGNTEYYAKSVKIHGLWIEMETESGPVWANSVVTIKPRAASASTITTPPGQGAASTKQADSAATQRVARVLSPRVAAELAARLANDECERRYRKRPFTAEQHAAVLAGDVYRWGRLDPGGPAGLSAVVTFRADGSQPDVQIYFSTDIR